MSDNRERMITRGIAVAAGAIALVALGADVVGVGRAAVAGADAGKAAGET